MSEPILVLNCGSSSIKFAVFEGSVAPLPRKPISSGKVEGIGSRNATLVDGAAAPLAALLAEAFAATTDADRASAFLGSNACTDALRADRKSGVTSRLEFPLYP